MMAAKGAIVPVVQADEGRRRAVRSRRPTCRPVAGYYTDSKGNMLSFPFNSSTVVFYVNKDAFKKAGLDPEQGAEDVEGIPRRRGQAEGLGPAVRRTRPAWPSWMHIENFSAWHNVPDRHEGKRHGGARHRVQDQLAAARAPHRDAGRPREEGHVHLRGPHQPGRGQVLERRVRDAHLVARARRPTSAATRSSSGR